MTQNKIFLAALAASALALATLASIGYPAHAKPQTAQILVFSSVYAPIDSSSLLGRSVRPSPFFGPAENTDTLYVLLAFPCKSKSKQPVRVLHEGTDRQALEAERKRLNATSGKLCFEVLEEDFD
jgi:hypothetical protein